MESRWYAESLRFWYAFSNCPGASNALVPAQTLRVKDPGPRTRTGKMHRMGKPKKVVQIDRYARDAAFWKVYAIQTHTCAQLIFQYGGLTLCLQAATIGHYALEMYLKAALISQGMTVFNPKEMPNLVPGESLTASDCVWGHSLVPLAELLSAKQPALDLEALDYTS